MKPVNRKKRKARRKDSESLEVEDEVVVGISDEKAKRSAKENKTSHAKDVNIPREKRRSFKREKVVKVNRNLDRIDLDPRSVKNRLPSKPKCSERESN